MYMYMYLHTVYMFIHVHVLYAQYMNVVWTCMLRSEYYTL